MPANPTFTDGDYSVASATSAFIQQPGFEGDNTPYLGTQTFVQAKASFAPLALGTAHPDDATFKLTREDSFTDLGAAVIQWVRHYAKVPAQRIEMRALAWTLPGLGMGGSNPIVPVSSVTGITTATTFYNSVTITTASAHGLSVGNYVVIYLADPADRFGSQLYTTAQVLTAPSTTTFTVAQGVLGSQPAASVQKYTPGSIDARKPETRTVPAKVVFDYFETADPTTVPLLEPTRIVDVNGLVTDTYLPNTTPTLAAYLAQVAAGDWLVAQTSNPRRWQGNIWERETIYVKAQ